MWRRKRIKLILDIFFVLLILAILFALFFGYRDISRVQMQEDQQLAASAAADKEKISNIEQESDELLKEEYEADMNVVAEYLPGIVCWGDVLTEGTASGVSFPKTLQSLINKYLVEQYDFRFTLEEPYAYPRVDWEQYKVEIPVVNMGTGKESSQTILGRSGAAPYVISKDFVIPEDSSPVDIVFTGYDGMDVKPLIYGDAGINPVTICGIEGTLITKESSYIDFAPGKYSFVRSAPGREMTVEAGEQIITASADSFRDYIHVIFIGTFGKYHNAKELAEQVRLMVSRQLQNTDRFIIIGNYTGTTNSSDFYDQFASIMTQNYGERFLNLRKYLLNEALTDCGITASKADISNVKRGILPESVFVIGSDTELQPFLYERLGKLVFERMDNLGYFDEVREELEIPEVEKVDAAEKDKR